MGFRLAGAIIKKTKKIQESLAGRDARLVSRLLAKNRGPPLRRCLKRATDSAQSPHRRTVTSSSLTFSKKRGCCVRYPAGMIDS
jgi:hypothetical protein